MKVVHCSTSVSNSSANVRIHKALLKCGIESRILVLFSKSNEIRGVDNIGNYGVKYRIYQKVAYYANIIEFLFLDKICKLRKGMPYTWMPLGIDISRISIIKGADIIHLHCTNSCYLSLRAIEQLSLLNKPIVITLHDSWFLTGGCHVLDGCVDYKDGCLVCNKISKGKFICNHHFKQKRKLMENEKFYFTAPSKWTYDNYIRSGLQKDKCMIIGNTLDFNTFNIRNKQTKNENERKIRLLFGALNSTETPYKGFDYLIKMLNKLYEKYQGMTEEVELHIFGAKSSSEKILKKFNCKFWGYIDSEIKMAELYNMCDIYIVPSLEDSFNQTVLESCACGTPVVSFRTGGICDIIRHKETGYLAKYKDEDDLLDGVIWVLNSNVNNWIGEAARKDVKNRFSQESIASKYIDVYMKIIKNMHKKEEN